MLQGESMEANGSRMHVSQALLIIYVYLLTQIQGLITTCMEISKETQSQM